MSTTKSEPPDPADSAHDLETGIRGNVGSENVQTPEVKQAIQDQSSRLPFKKLMVVFFGLAISLLLSFLDMTSVSTALPSIAREFQAASDVSWVGTSFLIANTSMQILYGRLSDVFGRKAVLMSAISLFAFGNLLCGFSRTMVRICFSTLIVDAIDRFSRSFGRWRRWDY
jgi:sugar phosphate permease